MASTLNKIGQSLLKYFKPVRTTLAHRAPKEFTVLVQGQPRKQHSDHEQAFAEEQERLKKQFKRVQKVKEEKSITELAFGPAQQRSAGNWVDLVVFLVGACRKVAEKLRQKGGVQFYRHTIDQQAARKIRTIGAIIDTTTEDISLKKNTKKIDEAA